jgi:hypothetical protein
MSAEVTIAILCSARGQAAMAVVSLDEILFTPLESRL